MAFYFGPVIDWQDFLSFYWLHCFFVVIIIFILGLVVSLLRGLTREVREPAWYAQWVRESKSRKR
ncbi:putative small transmembrane protein [Bolahun virus]|uniref:Putative small transmembrane protein n=2 Tax=Riboviria TaxID=2559587 RepID=A0A1C9U5E0_9MONO|nr:putative small transmembrane protein [Bolahun virus variant 2]AOR51376.1 putative small transmembrane protein [Bolahun virus variant 2]